MIENYDFQNSNIKLWSLRPSSSPNIFRYKRRYFLNKIVIDSHEIVTGYFIF